MSKSQVHPCRNCHGKGRVPGGEVRVGFAAVRTTMVPCLTCGGTGKVTITPKMKGEK